MATRSAKGTLQKLGDGASPEVFTTIGYVRSIAGPTTKATVQDGTTHSTAGNWMEKFSVLIDPGTLSFQINYDNADATHAFATGLWADLIALTERNFETILPASMGDMSYGGFLTSHAFDLPVDNLITAQIEVTINGAVTATQS